MEPEERQKVAKHLSECYFCNEYFQHEGEEYEAFKSEVNRYVTRARGPPIIEAMRVFYAPMCQCAVLCLLKQHPMQYVDLFEKSERVVERLASEGTGGIENAFMRSKTICDLVRLGYVSLHIRGRQVIPEVIGGIENIGSLITAGKVEITEAGSQWIEQEPQKRVRSLYSIDGIVETIS
jgi:hypothetical protein